MTFSLRSLQAFFFSPFRTMPQLVGAFHPSHAKMPRLDDNNLSLNNALLLAMGLGSFFLLIESQLKQNSRRKKKNVTIK